MYYKLITNNINLTTILLQISKISNFYIIISNPISNSNIYFIINNKDKLKHLLKNNTQIILFTTNYRKVIHKLVYKYLLNITSTTVKYIFIDNSLVNIKNIYIYNNLKFKYYTQLIYFTKPINSIINEFINNVKKQNYYLFNLNKKYLLFIKSFLLHINNTIYKITNHITSFKFNESTYYILDCLDSDSIFIYNYFINNIYDLNINYNLLILSNNKFKIKNTIYYTFTQLLRNQI